jgi:hypothetical protein
MFLLHVYAYVGILNSLVLLSWQPCFNSGNNISTEKYKMGTLAVHPYNVNAW